jgi:sucrose-6-phosphate hydrolase SacC (GH32 family)
VEVRVGASANLPAAGVVLESTGGHRTEVGLAEFAAATTYVREGGAWRAEPAAPRSARIIVDAGIVEVFTDDGRAAATSDLALETVSRVSLAGPGDVYADVVALSLPD